MGVLTTQVVRDEAFDARRELMEGLVAELRDRTARIARGGGEKAVERHRSRGKMTARERIDRLVDPGTAFLELNALAAWELYDGDAPSAGIVMKRSVETSCRMISIGKSGARSSGPIGCPVPG